jgi:hypothetical protein
MPPSTNYFNKETTMLKRFNGLLLGLVIGAVLIVVGMLDSHDALYRPHWNETVGEVVATAPVGPNTDPNLTRVFVRYTTAAGRTLEMPREFNLNAHPQFNVGNFVTVLYNEPNPLQHFIRMPNPGQDALAVAAQVGGGAIIVGALAFEGAKRVKGGRTQTAAA